MKKKAVNHFRFRYKKYPKYQNNKTLNWYVGTFIYINTFISSILPDDFLRHHNFYRFRYSIIPHVHYTEYIIQYYHFSLWFNIDFYQFYYYLFTFTSYCHLCHFEKPLLNDLLSFVINYLNPKPESQIHV